MHYGYGVDSESTLKLGIGCMQKKQEHFCYCYSEVCSVAAFLIMVTCANPFLWLLQIYI